MFFFLSSLNIINVLVALLVCLMNFDACCFNEFNADIQSLG